MEKAHDILSRGNSDCRVFVGTVPAVTIAPLARGVGNSRDEKDPFKVLDKATYFDLYTYFLFDHDYARRSGNSLTFDQAYEIDKTIADYNKTIKRLVASYNKRSTRVKDRRSSISSSTFATSCCVSPSSGTTASR